MKNIEKLAVDANPVFSAVIGGQARNIFLKAGRTEFFTTAFNFGEVERYLPRISAKKRLSIEVLYSTLSLLPIVTVDEAFYGAFMKKALSLIGKRDPDDAHLLALAMKLKCPIWTNDRDFDDAGVKIYTTLDLARRNS